MCDATNPLFVRRKIQHLQPPSFSSEGGFWGLRSPPRDGMEQQRRICTPRAEDYGLRRGGWRAVQSTVTALGRSGLPSPPHWAVSSDTKCIELLRYSWQQQCLRAMHLVSLDAALFN